MVKAKNLSTFAYLKRIVLYFLKQMTLQHISRVLLFAGAVVVFSSCLKTERTNPNWSSNAQIYAFSLSSSKDASRVLAGTKFTIDQLQQRIFNQDSLPYLFKVDSVMPKILNESGQLPKVTIHLKDRDSTYVWNGKDSVALNRLVKLTATAQDGKTAMNYTFQLNTHKQDPNILTWNKLASNYITGAIDEQKTLLLANAFFTYYKSGAEIKAMSSPHNDGKTWKPSSINGLPANVIIRSISTGKNAAYALDAANQVFKTTDGISWTRLDTKYPIKAILGNIPLFDGSSATLLIVKEGENLKFATTDDFTSFKVENTAIPTATPLIGFSSISVSSQKSFSAKFLIVAGGLKADNSPNKELWFFQKKGENLEVSTQETALSLEGGSLFFYNNILYLLEAKDSKNQLSFSDDFGLNWRVAGKNQAIPTDFAFRKNASILTDANNYIWIFGGKSTTQAVVDVWRGKLNALGN